MWKVHLGELLLGLSDKRIKSSNIAKMINQPEANIYYNLQTKVIQLKVMLETDYCMLIKYIYNGTAYFQDNNTYIFYKWKVLGIL